MINIDDLADRWGTLFGGINELDTFRGVTFPDRADDISALYPGFSTQRTITDGLYTQVQNVNNTLGQTVNYFMTLVRNTLNSMEIADTDPPADVQDVTVLNKLASDMLAQSETFQRPTLTVNSAVSAGGTPVTTIYGAPHGNGVIVGSVINPRNGLLHYYAFNEIIKAVCTADSFSTGTPLGQEVFNFTSPRSVPNTNDNYPQGSGTNIITASLPTDQNTVYGNAYFNSWGTVNNNEIQNWTTANLTPGTTILRSTDVYIGQYACNLVGAPINAELWQTINGLRSSTCYVAAIRVKRLTTVTTGVLTVALRDTTGAVVNDAAGSPMSFTVNLVGSAGNYALSYAVFPIPRGYPTGIRISLRLTTALSSGESILLDTSELVPMTSAYVGGPQFGFLPGNAGWSINDTYNFTVANSADVTSFIRCIDRVYNIRTLQIDLPTASSPTISDSLIT